MSPPRIVERHSIKEIPAGKMVERIIAHLDRSVLEGLGEIRILDKNEGGTSAFGAYLHGEGSIELYIDDFRDFPWILRATYVFPYLWIGTILGHEIDHHVNRSKRFPPEENERAAESNAFGYVYPSLGPFKPLFKVFAVLMKTRFCRGFFADVLNDQRG